MAQASTSILRQLIDAGTLSNLPAGFKARGFRVRDDDEPLQPGEFRDVDAPGGAIRDSLMPLPFKGPDGTLFQLLGFAVHKRMHYSMRQEFKLLARVMSEYLPQEYPYSVAGADSAVMREDFDDRIDVVPVSNPNVFSQAQRIAIAQSQLEC